jgi:hypothetical protein
MRSVFCDDCLYDAPVFEKNSKNCVGVNTHYRMRRSLQQVVLGICIPRLPSYLAEFASDNAIAAGTIT